MLRKREFKGPIEERIIAALRRTYQYIAPDLHNLPGSRRIKRKDLMDTVGDYYLGHCPGDPEDDKEAYEAWKKLSPKDQDDLLKQAFPSKVYE